MCTKFEKKILICFELSRPQGNFYGGGGGGGATDLNPIYPRLSSGDIIIVIIYIIIIVIFWNKMDVSSVTLLSRSYTTCS